jgi:hypothetical protein
MRLSEGIYKHQQLKKKSVITALNTVRASVYTQHSSEAHGAPQTQAIAKAPEKQSVYQILRLIDLFVVVVFKV